MIDFQYLRHLLFTRKSLAIIKIAEEIYSYILTFFDIHSKRKFRILLHVLLLEENMYSNERREKIVEIINDNEVISVKELTKIFNVSK